MFHWWMRRRREVFLTGLNELAETPADLHTSAVRWFSPTSVGLDELPPPSLPERSRRRKGGGRLELLIIPDVG